MSPAIVGWIALVLLAVVGAAVAVHEFGWDEVAPALIILVVMAVLVMAVLVIVTNQWPWEW